MRGPFAANNALALAATRAGVTIPLSQFDSKMPREPATATPSWGRSSHDQWIHAVLRARDGLQCLYYSNVKKL